MSTASSALWNQMHAARNKAEGVNWATKIVSDYDSMDDYQHLSGRLEDEHTRLTAEADRLWAEWEVAADSEPGGAPTLPDGYGVSYMGEWMYVATNGDCSWESKSCPTLLEAIADAHAHHLSKQHNGA